MTSPPYFALRSYLPSGDPLKQHELGDERTPAEYVANMVAVFREVRRVLHPTGCLFLNIADSYSGGGGYSPNAPSNLNGSRQSTNHGSKQGIRTPPGLKSKDLIGIPWELAFALRADGWGLRSEITWIKTSCMPESVSGWAWTKHKIKTGMDVSKRKKQETSPGNHHMLGDAYDFAAPLWQDCPGCATCTPNDGLVLRKGSGRPTSATESVFLLAANDSYYYDCEAVKKPGVFEPGTIRRAFTSPRAEAAGLVSHGNEGHGFIQESGFSNARNYLILGPAPLKEEHFASFPPSIPEFAIKAGSSERGVCSACLAPWARVVEREGGQEQKLWSGAGRANGCIAGGGHEGRTGQFWSTSETTAWRPTCSCSSGLLPSLVLDPFCGSGTSGLVALRLGRRFLGLELNPKYVQMARRRITGDAPLFNFQDEAV